MTQSPSSLTRTHWLASSKPKSCSSSTRFANSGSFFKLLPIVSLYFGLLSNIFPHLFLRRISHSGSGRASLPLMV